MSVTNINIRTDSEIKAKAQEIFVSLGLDMTTAINLFLRQTVKHRDLPFVIGVTSATDRTPDKSQRPPFRFGELRFDISDDFDDPLDDFKDYTT
jgi:DNA-damage-inducible protein J